LEHVVVPNVGKLQQGTEANGHRFSRSLQWFAVLFALLLLFISRCVGC
jgi:hypothetical protein